MNYFRKIDEHIRKKYPIIWVIGGHIFYPLLIVLNLGFFMVGYLESMMNNYVHTGIPYDQEFASGMLVGVLISIGLFIAFCIRQVKYNSTRMVFNLPDRGYFRFFMNYVLLILLIANLPIIGNAGRYVEITTDPYTVEAYSKWEAGEKVQGKSYLYHEIKNKNSNFYTLSWEFWRVFLLVPINLALLLLIACYVKKAHFGWGMLVLNLYPAIFGICTALAFLAFSDGRQDEEVWVFVLLTIFTGVAFYVGFVAQNIHQGLRNGFVIALQMALPLILIGYVESSFRIWDLYDIFGYDYEDEILLTAIYVANIFGLVAFKNVYKRRYLYPREA